MAESNPFPLCISKSRFQQDCRRCSEAAVQGFWDAPLHLHAAYKLFATTTEHGEFLYSASFSCLPAFVHPHNFWRDFRAKIVTVLLRKKTQWITATSPVLNPVAAVMVFHGLTSLKKNPKALKASSKQLLRWEAVSWGHTAPLCQGSLSKGRSLTSCWSLFPCLYAPVSSAWPTPNPKICFLKRERALGPLLPGSCCFVFLEEQAALIAIYTSRLPQNHTILRRERFCFQVSTHGNKQVNGEKSRIIFFF